MAKCEKCGSGRMSWWSGAIKFKDGKYICVKCLKELGHEHPLKEASYLSLQTSEDILHPEVRWAREWEETCKRRADRLAISPAQYNSLDKSGATDFEMGLFSRLCAILEDEGCDADRLVVTSGGGGSLMVFLGDILLLEYKGEPQIKWIRLSDDPDNKVRFGQLSKLNSLADRIVAIYRENE